MDIPWQQLEPSTLQALVEEFVSRDGTDYGFKEVPFETKCAQVLRVISEGKVKVVFDVETETCDLREVPGKIWATAPECTETKAALFAAAGGNLGSRLGSHRIWYTFPGTRLALALVMLQRRSSFVRPAGSLAGSWIVSLLLLIFTSILNATEALAAQTVSRSARISNLIHSTTERALARRWKRIASTVSQAILRESRKNGLDPLLVTAVIKHESRFDPIVRGRHGEIGLMQIKPSTAQWIAERSGIEWRGSRSLEDPATNILLGTAYLAQLKRDFVSRNRLFLSAYNVGSANVKRALKRKSIPARYYRKVEAHYRTLNLELHGQVMRAGRARSSI